MRDGRAVAFPKPGIEYKDCARRKAPSRCFLLGPRLRQQLPFDAVKASSARKPADAPKPVKMAITIQAEALFDFDKYVLKPEGEGPSTTQSPRWPRSTWKW